MSVFHGRQGKGALQRHRDDRYRAAVGRQLLLLDQGGDARNARGELIYPAPVEDFLRRGDELSRTDFRSYARGAS
jgi:hypothetical protein